MIETGYSDESFLRYLLEKYDKDNRLSGGKSDATRSAVRQWIHAAEGTFMIHALAITYARWFSTDSMKKNGDLHKLEQGLAINVHKDLDWLESQLQSKFLVGDHVTAADTMVAFSIQFIFAKDLAPPRKMVEWPKIKAWLQACEETPSYQRAVKKTGHEL